MRLVLDGDRLVAERALLNQVNGKLVLKVNLARLAFGPPTKTRATVTRHALKI